MRNAVYEAAMQMDVPLLRLLLANSTTRERFFADVEGIAVFEALSFTERMLHPRGEDQELLSNH